MKTKESKGHTELVLLANGYMEMGCINPWAVALLRIWIIRRIVSYASVDI